MNAVERHFRQSVKLMLEQPKQITSEAWARREIMFTVAFCIVTLVLADLAAFLSNTILINFCLLAVSFLVTMRNIEVFKARAKNKALLEAIDLAIPEELNANMEYQGKITFEEWLSAKQYFLAFRSGYETCRKAGIMLNNEIKKHF